jgi:hypothetical protein
MPTKESRRQARGLLEELESRAHAGPPVRENEIVSAREFLRQHDFPSASDYFSRLVQIQDRVGARPAARPQAKRNYGGEAAGWWMQVQSVYDHVILSTCHQGDFNLRRGRVKISHRFNQAGRIEFVELKFLRSLQPELNGGIRKLLTIKNHPRLGKDWHEAEAFALRVLPQELIFLFRDIFRCPRHEVLGWLINIGHRAVEDLLNALRARPVNGCAPRPPENPHQLCLKAVLEDEVALPILERAAALESSVEFDDPETVIVRYRHK